MVIDSNFSIQEFLRLLAKVTLENKDVPSVVDLRSPHLTKIWLSVYRIVGDKDVQNISELNLTVSGNAHANGFRHRAVGDSSDLFGLVEGQIRRSSDYKEMLKSVDENLVLEVVSAYSTSICLGITSGEISLGSTRVEEFYKAFSGIYEQIVENFNVNRKIYRDAIQDACQKEMSLSEFKDFSKKMAFIMRVIKNSLFAFAASKNDRFISHKLALIFAKEENYNVLNYYVEVMKKHNDLITNGNVDGWFMKDRHSLLVLSTSLKLAGFDTKYKQITKNDFR